MIILKLIIHVMFLQPTEISLYCYCSKIILGCYAASCFFFLLLIIDGLIFLALRKSTDLTALNFLICNVSSSQSYFCISVGVEKILVQVGVTTSRGGFLTRTDKTAVCSLASSYNTNLLPGRKLVETLSLCCLTHPSHPFSTLTVIGLVL